MAELVNLVAAIVLLSSTVSGLAEAASPEKVMKTEVYQAKESKLPYRWAKVGEGDDPALVLFLHGAGERGDDNKAQLAHGLTELLTWLEKEGESAVVVAPQCQRGVWWADLRGNFRSPKGGRLPGKPSEMMTMVFKVVPVGSSEVMVEALRKTGATVGFRKYPGVGHDSWSKTYGDPEVWEWLFTQKRA